MTTNSCMQSVSPSLSPLPLFFSNDTATTEIYTLSLHDALPIYLHPIVAQLRGGKHATAGCQIDRVVRDRKSTRLNSSHVSISYAVFCLKKKTPKPFVCHLSSSPRAGIPG